MVRKGESQAAVGRPTVAEIDLGALEHNYRQIEKRIQKGARILGVVKADAYGHGAVRVSRKLEGLGVAYLGVALVDEGIELRQGGLKAPILVLGGTFPGESEKVFRFDLTPVVFQKESLEELSHVATRRGQKARVHLKVDTGMNRLGVSLNAWSDFLGRVKRCSGIEVEGILSHFAMVDEEGGTYSHRQWKAFQEALSLAREKGISYRYAHIANSGNLAAFPPYSADLVRPGIMLYGCYPSAAHEPCLRLKPVMTWKTRIHFLKSVPPGARVSYGGTFVTERESRIAVLPVGYADGFRWSLSNRGEVLVGGRRAPVVGRVCMDYTLVDVTDVPGVRVGDEVVLIGKQGRERIRAEEVAEKAGTIAYEILCAVGKRVPRVHLDVTGVNRPREFLRKE